MLPRICNESVDPADRASLARQLSGIWRNRKDLKEVDRAIRRLRKGRRLKKFRFGSDRILLKGADVYPLNVA